MASRVMTGRAVLIGLLLVALGLGCSHEDPEPVGPSGPSYISVRTTATARTDIAGVPVVVDGEVVGRTPIIVEVTPGSHTVGVDSLGFVPVDTRRLIVPDSTVLARSGETHNVTFVLAPGFRRTVLVEDHTNIDCQGCEDAEEMLFDVLGEGGYTASEVLPISVHTAIPYTADPMFVANYREIYWRYSTFNGVAANPAFVIGGFRIPMVPPPKEVVQDSLSAYRARPSPVDLEVDHSVAGTTVGVDVTVLAVSDVPGDWRLLVMTLQTGIEYGTGMGLYPAGWVFRNVVRDLTPATPSPPATATTGHPITIEPGTVTLHFDAQLLTAANPPDDQTKLAVVVVLQNWTTKEILQAASTLE